MSVSRVLSNMSVETFASLGECAVVGKQWLAEYNQNKGGANKNSIELHFTHLKSKDDTENALKKILQGITSKKTLLMGVLSETLYTFYDAKASVDMLIDELTFYYNNIDVLYSESDHIPFQLDFTIRQQEIPILGRIFCPAIVANHILRMQIADEDCLPYFVALSDVINSTGCVPTGNQNREQIDVAFIEDFSAQHYCPMLIFDDSDLDSAVNSLVSATWSYQGKAIWSLSHVYIQEPYFFEAVRRIESMTMRFLKSNSFYFKHHENSVFSARDEKIGNLEIFQPNSNYPHRFFINWDPRTFLEKPRYNPCELGVVLLPFRTEEEGIALINKSRYACAASIWTESIARANSVSKRLDMGTVWINCHGLLKPEIPFESRKQSKIPFNGLRLLKLLQMPKNKCHDFDGALKTFSETANNMELICGTMNEAVNLALKASTALKSLDRKKMNDSLNPLLKCLSSLKFNSKFDTQNVVKTFNDFKVDTICWKESNRVILIEVPNFKENTVCLFWFINAALSLGNAVIVVMSSEDIDQITKYDCFKLPNLPKGSLSFVSKTIYKPRELIENSIVQKQIVIVEYDAKDICLNHIGYHTKVSPSSVSNILLMEVLLIGVKTVWLPN